MTVATRTNAETATGTHTTTVQAYDVRHIMSLMNREIRALSAAIAPSARSFDVDKTLYDCQILVLNNVIAAFHLEFHTGGELIRRHTYRVVTGSQPASGPDPEHAPSSELPAGARVRLTATQNTECPREERDYWLDQLKWRAAKPLQCPENVKTATYGAFMSGGFGLERQLMTNPKFDVPAASVWEQVDGLESLLD